MATESWLAAALATVATWGLGTLTSKPAAVRLGVRRMLSMVFFGEGVVYLVMFVLLRTDVPLDSGSVVAAFLAGLTGTLAYAFYYEGMHGGTVGLVGTVSAAYPILTVILSLGLLKETLVALQAVGIVLVLLCVLLLAWQPTEEHGTARRPVVLALLAFLAWGLWGFLTKIAVQGIGEGNVFGFYALSNVLVLAAYVPFVRNRTKAPVDGGHWSLALGIVTVCLGAAGAVTVTLAYAYGPASLVSPISGAYPVVATIAAHFLLKEAFGWRQGLALLLFGLGILLVAT